MCNKVKDIVWQLALHNSIQHGGKARKEAVLGKILADRPELKADIKTIIRIVEAVIIKVNNLPLQKQKLILKEKGPILFKEKAIQKGRELPPLPNFENYSFIHLRFCPNPDGALHLGGCRAAILDDEYAKRYNGCLTLRYDDTDPRTKRPIQEAYDWIREELEWLRVTWHTEVYQSDRLEIYYFYAKQLITMGFAYVCTCSPQEFKSLIHSHRGCPCRNIKPEEHLVRWNRMLDGRYREGESVVRIKTDLNHPNPAVREWPALRIIDIDKFPHPRVGDKYRVWPLFAYCCGIDDHELKISHILRGKEHLTNSTRQQFLYNYLGWQYPEAIHYGRLKMTDTVLSKSKIKQGINNGIYSNWDDPRLGTLKALRRRGFLPETVRQFILEIGPKPVDIEVHWSHLESINRKLIDSLANRFFFISNPVNLIIDNVKKNYVSRQPLHPNNPERGYRKFMIVPRKQRVSLWISKNDLGILTSKEIIRLMGLFNIKIKEKKEKVKAQFFSDSYLDAKSFKAPLIHWLPYSSGITTEVIMPNAMIAKGLAEDECKNLHKGEVIQFVRFGFVKIDKIDDKLTAYYTHR